MSTSPPSSTAAARTNSAEHVPALDGLRGIAIALVMVYHFQVYRPALSAVAAESLPERLLARLSAGGWLGVDLFFVLSGFLITGILLDAKARGGDHYFRNFYARRVLRILPLYYGFLLFLLVIGPLFAWAGPNRLDVLRAHQGWYWTHFTNVYFVLDGWHRLTGHFWSLATEEQFYFIWPLAVYGLRRRWLAVACVGLIVGSIAGRWILHGVTFANEPGYLLARMDSLAAGALLAIAVRHPHARRLITQRARAVALIAGTILLAYWARFSLFELAFGVQVFAMPVATALFVALVAIAATRDPEASPLARTLTSPVLRMLGRLSYALYLFHQPLIVAWQAPRAFIERMPLIGRSTVASQLVYIAVVSVSLLGLTNASWHLYEKQFLKLKSHFPYSRPPVPPRQAPVEAPLAVPGFGVHAAWERPAVHD